MYIDATYLITKIPVNFCLISKYAKSNAENTSTVYLNTLLAFAFIHMQSSKCTNKLSNCCGSNYLYAYIQ